MKKLYEQPVGEWAKPYLQPDAREAKKIWSKIWERKDKKQTKNEWINIYPTLSRQHLKNIKLENIWPRWHTQIWG